ncbi:hypothetical protein LINGRAHAP2_LOCUS10209 [Linum grandiflorum]
MKPVAVQPEDEARIPVPLQFNQFQLPQTHLPSTSTAPVARPIQFSSIQLADPFFQQPMPAPPVISMTTSEAVNLFQASEYATNVAAVDCAEAVLQPTSPQNPIIEQKLVSSHDLGQELSNTSDASIDAATGAMNLQRNSSLVAETVKQGRRFTRQQAKAKGVKFGLNEMDDMLWDRKRAAEEEYHADESSAKKQNVTADSVEGASHEWAPAAK